MDKDILVLRLGGFNGLVHDALRGRRSLCLTLGDQRQSERQRQYDSGLFAELHWALVSLSPWGRRCVSPNSPLLEFGDTRLGPHTGFTKNPGFWRLRVSLPDVQSRILQEVAMIRSAV